MTDTAARAFDGRVAEDPSALRPLLVGSGTGEESGGRLRLRRRLVLTDVAALGVGWLGSAVALSAGAPGTAMQASLLFAAVAAGSCLAVMAARGLHRARVCSVRAVETQLLARAVLTASAGAAVIATLADVSGMLALAFLGGAASLALLVVFRGMYRSWLAGQRRSGRCTRSVLLLGANDDAQELLALTRDHPELGFRITGVVASLGDAAGMGLPWYGDVKSLERGLTTTLVDGVIIAANALPPEDLTRISRHLVDRGCHVHLSSGLRGIATNRLRALPLAHEPLFYLERATLSPWQKRVKRAMDLTVSSIGLVASIPVLAAAAAAIKLEDGGPVFFRQVRVGKDEAPFTMYKLRTMRPDAEERRLEVAERNQREGGPLFKAQDDPRVTRVGKVLRATSIDELAQFLNVLQGTMSLVGPRPALPREYVKFDAQLQARTTVAPGITGLWQTEARDNPNFGAYRRLDLHYVENWSLGLDFAILLATAEEVIARAGRVIASRLPRGLRKKRIAQVIVLD